MLTFQQAAAARGTSTEAITDRHKLRPLVWNKEYVVVGKTKLKLPVTVWNKEYVVVGKTKLKPPVTVWNKEYVVVGKTKLKRPVTLVENEPLPVPAQTEAENCHDQ